MNTDALNNNETSQINPDRGKAQKVIFFTLFIDLIGFSIIFPLFPGMLEYYRAIDGDTGLFGWLYHGLEHFSAAAGAPDPGWGIIVLFGGVISALYSLLQFFFAPIFGALSDRWGRRPVLLFCISGILISYLMWIVAGSFLVLVLARLLGGIMSANISTATAVVADITDRQTRSRGMALIGIAFGVGFIVGPAIGGISATFDPSTVWPGLAQYGVNPYSCPAAIAAILTGINLIMVLFWLPETRFLQSASPSVQRTLNPAALFHMKSYPGVARTNYAYFFFLLAFAGMEFSLTFLAADKLRFDHRQNAYMFVFVGVIMALVQGGYVRRKAEKVGLKRMTLQGLFMIIPALALIGLAGQRESVGILYGGLFLLAIGSAFTTPCLTTLVSVYAPPEEQGRITGIFRSLGALGRAGGPLLGCLLYWRLGAALAYYIGAVSICIPLAITLALPAPPAHPDAAA